MLALAGGTVVLGVAVLSSDVTHLDAARIADRVRASGALGPAALIGLLVAQAVIAPLPAPPLLVAAGYVYGPWRGAAIGWLGLLLGASACFGLGRALGRPFVERFVAARHLATVDGWIRGGSGTAFLTVLSARVLLPPLFDPVSYACGLVGFPFLSFVIATALGEIPKVGSFTYVGAAAGRAPTWLTTWIMLAPLVGVIAFRLLWRATRGRRAPAAG